LPPPQMFVDFKSEIERRTRDREELDL
jgi:hypothetical protein